MDENKIEGLGEMSGLGAICKTPDGEILYVESPKAQQNFDSHRTVDPKFNLAKSDGHDDIEYLDPTDCNDVNHLPPKDTPAAEHPPCVIMPPQRPPARLIPITLFVLTCLTTLAAGTPSIAQKIITFFITQGRLPHGITWPVFTENLFSGFQYAAPLMLILLCHEMGHYIQARRNRIPASLPYFIPIPFGFLGTMGAVIGMRANLGDRRSLFDIGITGPLAGLVPTLIFLVVGLHFSEIGPISYDKIRFGQPLLMQWLIHFKFGTLPVGQEVLFHPMAFAAWVGLLITSLNLLPIGQLDGGHVLHALMPRGAVFVARFILWGAIAASFYFQYTIWALMILLLLMMGPKHPPTADDKTPIGPFRYVLGWLTLAFILIGFTPMPIKLL